MAASYVSVDITGASDAGLAHDLQSGGEIVASYATGALMDTSQNPVASNPAYFGGRESRLGVRAAFGGATRHIMSTCDCILGAKRVARRAGVIWGKLSAVSAAR